MNNEFAAFTDQRLQYFKTKSPVKGTGSFDRLKTVAQRWEKVIDDCDKSSDRSSYRCAFKECHKIPLSFVQKSIQNLESNDDILVRNTIDKLISKIVFLLQGTKDETAESDALSFMIAELDNCK